MKVTSKGSSRRKTKEQLLREKGVRSGLEDEIRQYLRYMKVGFKYEAHRIPWVPPQRTNHYTPDFFLENGIIIESKGVFSTADRQKMIQVKKQHPNLDIRFVFSNSKTKLSTQKDTRFRAWAKKQGIKTIPRTGPSRDALKQRFFDHLREQGKQPPSQTTYGMWADKNGFPYSDELPPLEWLSASPNEVSLEALKEIISK